MSEVTQEHEAGSEILRGRNVLLVEDNGLLSCVLEETLRAAGCEVIGPFARLSEAMTAVPQLRIDAALLDVNVRGVLVSPLAEHLNRRGVPFVLTSAYPPRDLPVVLRSAVHLRKPFTGTDVLERLSEVISEADRKH